MAGFVKPGREMHWLASLSSTAPVGVEPWLRLYAFLSAPATVIPWWCLMLSVVFSWTLHPRKRASGSVTVDLILVVALPAVASGVAVWEASALLQVVDDPTHTASSFYVYSKPLATIVTAMDIVKTFMAVNSVLFSIAMWNRCLVRAAFVATAGICCLAADVYVDFQALKLRGLPVCDSWYELCPPVEIDSSAFKSRTVADLSVLLRIKTSLLLVCQVLAASIVVLIYLDRAALHENPTTTYVVPDDDGEELSDTFKTHTTESRVGVSTLPPRLKSLSHFSSAIFPLSMFVGAISEIPRIVEWPPMLWPHSIHVPGMFPCLGSRLPPDPLTRWAVLTASAIAVLYSFSNVFAALVMSWALRVQYTRLGTILASRLRPGYLAREDFQSVVMALNLVKIMFDLATRPTLSKGRTRLEWICSCGDPLYGDFEERTPGSLRKLADQLGATSIISGSPSSGSTSTAPITPARPLQAALRVSSSPSQQGRTSGSSSSGNPPNAQNPQSGVATVPSNPSPGVLKKKYLELCTQAENGYHRLSEIDVGSAQSRPLSDRVTFEKIKAQYERDRTVVRMFGFFATHRPAFGNFVQFRTDRRPWIAVDKTSKQSVPPEDEVRSGNYQYSPVPMDEPVMPPRIFIHYLTKTTQAHTEAIWAARFPHKLGDSIFYQSKPLTVGWGIEIEEVRNWRLFVVAQLVVLLASGAVTAVYAVLKDDIPTGVAIGGWLTAVQSLIVALLFFRWT